MSVQQFRRSRKAHLRAAVLLCGCLIVASVTAGCGSRSAGNNGHQSSESGRWESSRHFDFWVPAGWRVDRKEHHDDWGKGEALRLVPPGTDVAAVTLLAQAADLQVAGQDAVFRMLAATQTALASQAVTGSIRTGTAQVAGAKREVIRCRVAGSKTGRETELMGASFGVGNVHFWIQAFEPEGEHRARIRYILAAVRVKP